MNKNFQIIPTELLDDFHKAIDFNPMQKLKEKSEEELPVDYFQFYQSTSSVYSSKIEEEDIDYDSYFKHKFLKVKYLPDYTKKADDLFDAYQFIRKNSLTESHIIKVHQILSSHSS